MAERVHVTSPFWGIRSGRSLFRPPKIEERSEGAFLLYASGIRDVIMAYKISLAGWSINRRFRAQENPLQLLEFPKVTREEFDIRAVELNSPFFRSTEKEYLDQLKAAAGAAGVEMVGIAVDGTGDPSSADEGARKASVEKIRPWFKIAKYLGIKVFRANAGGYGRELDPKALEQCIKSFKELREEAEATGVKILMENHGGLSVNPINLVTIIKEVGGELIGTLPDFGNFPDTTWRPEWLPLLRKGAPSDIADDDLKYWAIETIAPYAGSVHVKTHDFDSEGNDTRVDIGRCVRILAAAGYKGYWGIEYEGKDDDHVGVLKTKALLEKSLAAAGL